MSKCCFVRNFYFFLLFSGFSLTRKKKCGIWTGKMTQDIHELSLYKFDIFEKLIQAQLYNVGSLYKMNSWSCSLEKINIIRRKERDLVASVNLQFYLGSQIFSLKAALSSTFSRFNADHILFTVWSYWIAACIKRFLHSWS